VERESSEFVQVSLKAKKISINVSIKITLSSDLTNDLVILPERGVKMPITRT